MRYLRGLMLGVTLIALAVACAGYTILREVNAAAGSSTQPVEVIIEAGDTTSQIANRLSAAGLLRQPMLFSLLVRLQGLDGKLQAGRYQLYPAMTMSDILVALQFSRVEEIEVTLPEGLRIEEVAERLASAGLFNADAFIAAARNADAFKPNHFLLGSVPPGASLEGYLFPDTYRIAATSSVTDVIEKMLTRFDEQYATIERDVRVPNASVHEIVTMASIVQREAALIDEMPLIGAVFWNRLDPERADETGGGRLQADATVQYALGYSPVEETWWRKNLLLIDLQIDNPYNTREVTGLPPGPIANPGLAALRSAAQPDESADYLYFVASCALDGTHNFAVTFEEFQELEAEFLACNGS